MLLGHQSKHHQLQHLRYSIVCMCHALQGPRFARSSSQNNVRRKPLKNRQDTINTLICQTSAYLLCHRKLSSGVDDSELSMSGFAIFHSDRNRHGGGVAIYCCKSLRPKRIPCTCIKVSTTNVKHLSVCCIYRPPTSTASWKGAFFTLTDIIMSTSTPCIITGDFNINLMSNSQFAEDLSSTFDLKQHITNATRITATYFQQISIY